MPAPGPVCQATRWSRKAEADPGPGGARSRSLAQSHLLELVLDLPPAGRHLLGGDHPAAGRQGRTLPLAPTCRRLFRPPVTAPAPSWARQGTLRMRSDASRHLGSGLRFRSGQQASAAARMRRCPRGEQAHAHCPSWRPGWEWRAGCAAMLEVVWRGSVGHPLSARAGLAARARHPHYGQAETNPSESSISDVPTAHGVLRKLQSYPASPLLTC